MKYKKLNYFSLAFMVFGLSATFAQENLNSAGGNAIGGGGSLSYSIGQTAYSTKTGSNGTVTEGVQQAFEISKIGIDEIEDVSISIHAYPNPTSDFIVLEIRDSDAPEFDFELYDLHGRSVVQQKITQNQTVIHMAGLSAATYFAKVRKGNQETHFKIIKN